MSAEEKAGAIDRALETGNWERIVNETRARFNEDLPKVESKIGDQGYGDVERQGRRVSYDQEDGIVHVIQEYETSVGPVEVLAEVSEEEGYTVEIHHRRNRN
ncbi:MAG: hypothetical protein MUP63_01405 [Candidatus Nanohaloarchaeota archaeon QJJ-7]|nr:hypothetical protein [Candidatus Nanohaloarchaeota archaeon QJJ-7]